MKLSKNISLAETFSKGFLVRFSLLALLTVCLVGGASSASSSIDMTVNYNSNPQGFASQVDIDSGVGKGYFTDINTVTAYSSGDIVLEVKDVSGNVVASKTKSYPGDDTLVEFDFSKSDYSSLLEGGNTVSVDFSSSTADLHRDDSRSASSSLFSFSSEPVSGGSDALLMRFTEANTAPQFNSSSVEPDPPLIGESVSYGAEVFDSDGSISYTNLTVQYGGSTVLSDEQRTGTTSPVWNDVFTPQDGNKWLNTTLEVVDDKGAVTEKQINRYLSNDAPEIVDRDPGNTTYWKYGIPVDFDATDSDSLPDEDLTCETRLDGDLRRNETKQEGSRFNYTLQAEKGQHTLNITCRDSAGNEESKEIDFTVKYSEFNSKNAASQIYETKDPIYNADLDTGEMINNVNFYLDWNGSVADTGNASSNGHEELDAMLTKTDVPLVDQNKTEINWSITAELNRSRFNASGYTFENVTTDSSSQEILHSYYLENSGVVDQDLIEKEDLQHFAKIHAETFEAELTGTTNYYRNGDTGSMQVVENGSTYQRLQGSVDTGIIEDDSIKEDSWNTDSQVTVSFNGRSRPIPTPNATVNVHKKIITDCSNSVNGVTGEKALTFALKNEEDRDQKLNGSLDFNFDTTHHGEHERNYAFNKDGVKTQDLCMWPGWANYRITGPLQYESAQDQNTNNLLYPQRSYNLYNTSIDNNTETIDLYLLADSIATPVYFTVEDKEGNGVSDATIQIMRYFLGSNSYITVAKTETDSQGIATTYMHINEIYYKYLITKDGKTLKETDRQIFTCNSNPCSRTFRVNPQIRSDFYEEKSKFDYSCSKIRNENETVTGYQCTVNHESDAGAKANLKVTKGSITGNSKTVCDITEEAKASSMVCEFNEESDGNVYEISLTGIKDGETFTLLTETLDYGKGLFGTDQEVAGIMLFLGISSLFMISPRVYIASLTVSLGLTVWWGLFTISLSALASLAFIGIAMLIAGGRS